MHLAETSQDHKVDCMGIAQRGPQRLRGACACGRDQREGHCGNPVLRRILPAAAPGLVAHNYLCERHTAIAGLCVAWRMAE